MRRALLIVMVGIFLQGLGAGPAYTAQDASSAASQVLERYSQLLAKGSQEISQGRYGEAQRTLEEAVRLDPGNPRAHHQLAWALYFQGRIDEAIGILVKINGAVETARGHIDLAFFYLAKEEPTRALPHAKRAVELEPKTALAHARLGECYLRMGDFDPAIAAFKTANALQETSASHVSIGNALLAQNKRAEAFKSFERAATIDPDAAWIVAEAKARIELAEGRPEAAVGFLAQAVEAATPFVRPALTDRLVALCLEIGDFQRAAAFYGDRRWIGVTLSPASRGIEIVAVARNGPADLAGLNAGDLIVEFEGRPLAGVDGRRVGEMLGTVPHGGTARMTIERQGRRVDKAVVVGLSPDLPRRAREAESDKAAVQPAPPLPQSPSIAITSLAVEPSPVPAGGDFAVDIHFSITVPSGPADLTVTLDCAISRGGERVYEPERVSFEAPNGRPFKIRRKLSAGTSTGDYSVRIRLAGGSVSIEKSVDFAIK